MVFPVYHPKASTFQPLEMPWPSIFFHISYNYYHSTDNFTALEHDQEHKLHYDIWKKKSWLSSASLTRVNKKV